jgi:pSer/pThr/pTyr-binding forkhead associated (FHA) protein
MSDTTTTAPLHVRYTDPKGKTAELILGDKPITIGRSPDADIITLDERASRMHCGIRIWDGEYYIKDLKSKNGTYLNNQRVEMAKIKPGDKIRLGNSILHIDDKKSPGTATTLDNVQNEMNEGKGYKTILREIVENTEKGPLKPSLAPKAPPAASQEAKPAAASSSEVKSKTARLISGPIEDVKSAPETKPAGSDSKLVVRKPPTAIKIKRN